MELLLDQHDGRHGLQVADLVLRIARLEADVPAVGQVEADRAEDRLVIDPGFAEQQRRRRRQVVALLQVAAARVVEDARQPAEFLRLRRLDAQFAGPLGAVGDLVARHAAGAHRIGRRPDVARRTRHRRRGDRVARLVSRVVPVLDVRVEQAGIGHQLERIEVPDQLRRQSRRVAVEARVALQAGAIEGRAGLLRDRATIILAGRIQVTVVGEPVLQRHGGHAVVHLRVARADEGREHPAAAEFQRAVEVRRFLVADLAAVERVVVHAAERVIAAVQHEEQPVVDDRPAEQQVGLVVLVLGGAHADPVFGRVRALLGDQVDGAGERAAAEQRRLRALDDLHAFDDVERESQDRVREQHAVHEDGRIALAEDVRHAADHRPADAALHPVAVQPLEREARREPGQVVDVLRVRRL